MAKPVSLSAVREARLTGGQMSHANRFGGGARVRVIPIVDVAEFRAWWAGLLRRRCGADAVEIARIFGHSVQTGRNWLAEDSSPLAHDTDLAMALWPEDFIARHAPHLLRRAA